MMTTTIPASLEAEHGALRDELHDLAAAGGTLGETAKKVLAVLEPHLEREDVLVHPILASLAELAEGRIETATADLILLANRLREAVPAMRAEHVEIAAALADLVAAARAANREDAIDLAERLLRHARLEEEFLYPAAMIAGEYLKLRITFDDPRAV
ncbi:MAG TPA: hemerythrin domain-containing protein [Planctomycetota bacterium]|nr:hemerythrin domain-containing protein [Planctomycetota bacterium]